MRSSFVIALLTWASTALALVNSTREFFIKTEVVAGQSADLARFDGLNLTGAHSGAGLSDAVLLGSGVKAFFNVTDPVKLQASGEPYYNLVFDFGGTFPWAPQIQNVDFYAEWLPININAGNTTQEGVWFFNSTGVHITSSPADPSQNGYGGWMVCDWYRGVPQLFVKIAYYNITNPSSCADVMLMQQYI